MATPPGFIQVNEVNNAAFQNAFATLATMSGVPLIGNPEAMAQRLEELTSIVGTLAEALAHTAPVINNNLANTNLLAAHAVSLETQNSHSGHKGRLRRVSKSTRNRYPK
jgi:hypothetical protein